MENKLEKYSSNIEQNYWEGKGVYQAELDRLTKKFMPTSGRARNYIGEVIRAINRLYYEFCNNGNCNALDCETIPGEWVECSRCAGVGYTEEEYDDGEVCAEECPDCGGDGGYYEEDEEEYSLNKFFGNFIELLNQFFSERNASDGIVALNGVKSIIENQYAPIAVNIHTYDSLIDNVVWLVLQEEDNESPIPSWYENN